MIVAAQKRTLGGRELQLPCMSSLTSKTSTQKFFLRVLQVIIQLREDTRRANKKAKQTGRLGKMIFQLQSLRALYGIFSKRKLKPVICSNARLQQPGLSQQHPGRSAAA